MIATLSGKVSEKLADVVVLDVHGVGYGLLVTTEDYGRLNTGDTAKVYVYEHIREQAHDLFGFLSLDTKQLFELLLDVNGVGPKMALSILSIGTANDVRAAIATGDVKFITAAQGVGKRVAERVVVELKDKVGAIMPNGTVLQDLRLDSELTGALDLQAGAVSYNAASQVQVNLNDPTNGIFTKADIVSIACGTQADGQYPCRVTLKAEFDAENDFMLLSDERTAN